MHQFRGVSQQPTSDRKAKNRRVGKAIQNVVRRRPMDLVLSCFQIAHVRRNNRRQLSRVADHYDARGQIRDRHELRRRQLVRLIDDHEIETTRAQPIEIRRQKIGIRDNDAGTTLSTELQPFDGLISPPSFQAKRDASHVRARVEEAITQKPVHDVVELTYARSHHQNAHKRLGYRYRASAFDQKGLSCPRWRLDDDDRIRAEESLIDRRVENTIGIITKTWRLALMSV